MLRLNSACRCFEGGVDGYAIIQIEKRKRAEGRPLYFDPLLPPEDR